MEAEIIEVQKCKKCHSGKRCSDYDDECVFVKDHYKCFIGINSEGLDIGVADGYCPFIHTPN